MWAAIKAYNKATDTPEAIDNSYHETITQAYVRLVFAANLQTGPHESSEEFSEMHPELLKKQALLNYYSREGIMAMDAKVEFIEPDLCSLPIVVGDSITISDIGDGGSLATVKRLFVEFSESLDFDLCFHGFDCRRQSENEASGGMWPSDENRSVVRSKLRRSDKCMRFSQRIHRLTRITRSLPAF